MSGPRGKNVWTLDRIYLLAQCFACGDSMDEIARMLGCFTHCEDNGRNAVIGKVKRLRESAKSEAEQNFWSRGSGRVINKRSAPRKKGGQFVFRKTYAKNAQSQPLSPLERDTTIDSVFVPAITVSDEEVQNAFVRQLITGKAPDYERVNWSKSASTASDDTDDHKCTETVSGMVPCGKPSVTRTARCVAHGGNAIALIKLTGQERLQMRARETD